MTGEESNVVSIHKKVSKNLIRNYQPISLLPIFNNVFERFNLIFLFNYFIQNKLFTDCQSGFISSDSCVDGLLSIMLEIHKSFGCNPTCDIRRTFLDILKTSDKVLHKDLTFILQSYGVDGSLLKRVC